MANWNGLQLTNKGIALQAKVQAGTQLHITKLKLGSGVVPSGTDIKTLTDLITPEQNLGIGGKEPLDDYCKISSTISNTELETGYYVRELGVFAQDPDEGEILYLYTTDGAPDYLPAGGGSTVISQEFSVMIAVDDTDNILVDIDPAALATMGYVQLQIQEHNTDTTAHADFTGATAEVTGERGMVPAPAAGDQNKALFGDATYKQVVQKVNGVAPDSAGNVSLPITTYSNLSQIDLTYENATWTDIYSKLPFGSILIFPANTSPESGIYAPNLNLPFSAGTVIVTKGTAQYYAQIEFYSHNTNVPQIYVALASATTVTDWKQMATTDILPVGTILPFAGSTIPYGFLACNGAAVSRTTYAALFSAIGTTYGSGDGSTTFNLPAVEDNRFLEFASTAGTKKAPGLPNIIGSFKTWQDGTGADTGAFESLTDYMTNWGGHSPGKNGEIPYQHNFNASRSNAIYGASTTVQPKSLTVRAIIKY